MTAVGRDASILLADQEDDVARILVRDLEESTVEALKARAKANNRSLQGEVKAILEGAADDADRRRRFRESVEARQAYWKAQGKTFSDSAEIIRELRDER